MRNPRRWRRLALAALPLGIGLVLVANRMDGGVAVAFGMPGIIALLFGGVLALWAHRAARAQARLERGEGELARWLVDAGTLRSFADHERTQAGTARALPNELSLPKKIPAAGIGVIVGEDAILVGDSVHVLPRHGAPEVLEALLVDGGGLAPHVAELRLRHPPTPRRGGGMTPPLYTRLSFPLPATAWREARVAIGFYARGRPGKASFFHGRGDGSDPEDASTCSRCGHTTHVFRSTCPQCGTGIVSKRWIRRFGALLVVLGSVLAIGMAVLLWVMSPMLANPGVDNGGTRFTGTPAQALAIWAILAAVLAFGATAIGAGIWQLATGKRNLRAAAFMLAIFSGLLLVSRLLP